MGGAGAAFAKMPKGYVETMQYGMINWVVPLARFLETYNGQSLSVLALGPSQPSKSPSIRLSISSPAGSGAPPPGVRGLDPGSELGGLAQRSAGAQTLSPVLRAKQHSLSRLIPSR